jgi:hypothetical protein
MKHRQLEEVAQPAFKRTARIKARFLRFIDVNAGARVSWKIVLLWGGGIKSNRVRIKNGLAGIEEV